MGKLDAILYACLVTGYNSKNISSITVSNNIATVTTSTNHGYNVYDIIAISGANESVFNDSFTIASVPSTTTFTFSITTGLSSASGSMIVKIAPLGWTREFTGTNKSVYRSSDVTSNRLYLRVDDTNAQYTLLNIYETMSSVDVGTGKSTDVYWVKSGTANNTSRPWYLVGDSKRFYFMTHFHATFVNNGSIYFFGDINSFRNPDPWATCLCGHSVSNPTTPGHYTAMPVIDASTSTGLVIARNYSWLGSSGAIALSSVPRWATIGCGNSTTVSFPSVSNFSINLFPIYAIDVSLTLKPIRGVMPGYYAPYESPDGVFSPKDRTVFYGGKTYMAFRSTQPGTAYYGNYWLDITGPW